MSIYLFILGKQLCACPSLVKHAFGVGSIFSFHQKCWKWFVIIYECRSKYKYASFNLEVPWIKTCHFAFNRVLNSSGASVLTEETLIYYLHICSHIHSILQYWAGCIILQIVQSADSSHLSAASCKSGKWTTGLLVVHVCSWNILCAQNRRQKQVLSLKIARPLSWCFFPPQKLKQVTS